MLDNYRNEILDEGFSSTLTKHLFSGKSIAINVILAILIIAIVVFVIIILKRSTRKRELLPYTQADRHKTAVQI